MEYHSIFPIRQVQTCALTDSLPLRHLLRHHPVIAAAISNGGQGSPFLYVALPASTHSSLERRGTPV